MSRPRNIVLLTENYRNLSWRFYHHQKQIGYVLETCRSRQIFLEEFLSWLEEKGINQVEKISSQHIQNYYEYISGRPNKNKAGSLSVVSTTAHIRALSLMFGMLQASGEINLNPISTLFFPKPQQENERIALTQEQIKELYEVCISAWERAILSLAYGCGLRAREMQELNITDVRLREKIIIVQHGKGNKRRVVPMSPGVAEDLSDYYFLEQEKLTKGRDYNPKDAAFMLNTRGGRMRKYTYNKYLKRIIERTESENIIDKNISLHHLRHSIATHLLEQGVPVDQVRQFLGHSQLETTQNYTHISQYQLKKLME